VEDALTRAGNDALKRRARALAAREGIRYPEALARLLAESFRTQAIVPIHEAENPEVSPTHSTHVLTFEEIEQALQSMTPESLETLASVPEVERFDALARQLEGLASVPVAEFEALARMAADSVMSDSVVRQIEAFSVPEVERFDALARQLDGQVSVPAVEQFEEIAQMSAHYAPPASLLKQVEETALMVDRLLREVQGF
jgi:hypothetical protein